MKLLSYNVQEGGDDRLPDLVGVIRRQRPDAVALLEANSSANAEPLARELGMDLVFGEANRAYHVTCLSCLPIQRWENHRHPALAKTLPEIEVIWEGMPLRLFAAHLASRHEPPEPADEIRVILGLLGPLVAQPHLLAGDLNALRPGDFVGKPPLGVTKRGDAAEGTTRVAITRLVAAGYVDAYRARHPCAPGYTYPSGTPWLRLDYIVASPAVAAHLAACDVVTGAAAAQASDHLPLRAAFR